MNCLGPIFVEGATKGPQKSSVVGKRRKKVCERNPENEAVSKKRHIQKAWRHVNKNETKRGEELLFWTRRICLWLLQRCSLVPKQQRWDCDIFAVEMGRKELGNVGRLPVSQKRTTTHPEKRVICVVVGR